MKQYSEESAFGFIDEVFQVIGIKIYQRQHIRNMCKDEFEPEKIYNLVSAFDTIKDAIKTIFLSYYGSSIRCGHFDQFRDAISKVFEDKVYDNLEFQAASLLQKFPLYDIDSYFDILLVYLRCILVAHQNGFIPKIEQL